MPLASSRVLAASRPLPYCLELSQRRSSSPVPPGSWRTGMSTGPLARRVPGGDRHGLHAHSGVARLRESKATLLRAIRSGRLSAARDDGAGSWLIEESELHRVYPPGSPVPGTSAVNDVPRTPDRTAEFEARIAEMHEAARLRNDTIDDLRRRLDTATAQLGEALTQVRLLTDQRQPARRSWWSWGRKLGVAAAVWLGVSGPASSYTGNELLERCLARSEVGDPIAAHREGLCLGFIWGVEDALQISAAICSPKGIERSQVSDVVIHYLQAYPELRDRWAVYLVRDELVAAFPCQR